MIKTMADLHPDCSDATLNCLQADTSYNQYYEIVSFSVEQKHIHYRLKMPAQKAGYLKYPTSAYRGTTSLKQRAPLSWV